MTGRVVIGIKPPAQASVFLLDVPKTGVFEHPLHTPLASFGQLFNNHVQQQQRFNKGIKGLVTSLVQSPAAWGKYRRHA